MEKPNVYVTRMIPQEGIDLLKAHCNVEVNGEDRPLKRDELLKKVKGRDGILCLFTDRIDGDVRHGADGERVCQLCRWLRQYRR